MITPGQMFSSVSASTSILVVAYIFLLRRISTLEKGAESEWSYNCFSILLSVSIFIGGASLLIGATFLFLLYDITLVSVANMEQGATYTGLICVVFVIQGLALSIGSVVLQWKEPL